MNNFKKTEQLLYNYTRFKKTLKYKKDYIKFLKENGLQETSKNFVGTKKPENNKDKTDILDDLITKLEKDITYIEKHINFINLALENIRDDTYYPLIDLKYFHGKTMEYIAEFFNISVTTTYKQRDRLINIVKNILFAEDAIKEIFSDI